MTATLPPPARPRPQPRPHPRIRARRIEIRRDEGRRRRRRLAAAAAVAGLVAAAVGASRSPLLDLDRIEVSGALRVRPAEVRRAADLPTGTPLVDVDPAAVARRVRAVPWVAQASVERRWPGTVAIAIVERRPVAQLVHPAGGVVLADADGRLLAREPAPVEGLVTVVGLRPGRPGTVLRPARPALRVADALSTELSGQVADIGRDGADLVLRLRLGGLVRLGGTDQLDAKLADLEVLLSTVPVRCIALLDVRVPGSSALTRHPGCA